MSLIPLVQISQATSLLGRVISLVFPQCVQVGVPRQRARSNQAMAWGSVANMVTTSRMLRWGMIHNLSMFREVAGREPVK